MKKAVGGKTRVDLAVDQIIQVILDRDMKAGDKLPNEYDLAHELGVGRSTLREAIKRLVARNILTARQGAGTFVSEKNGVPEDPLGLTFMMEEGSENLALDLQDIRLMLEPETCAIVARGATPEQIDQMQAYCDEATRLIEAEEDYSAADAKFHQYLAECSGNHVLPNLIPIIASATAISTALRARGVSPCEGRLPDRPCPTVRTSCSRSCSSVTPASPSARQAAPPSSRSSPSRICSQPT